MSGLVALSYGGGIAAGVLVEWLGIRLRHPVRRLGETMLDNLAIILIPFSAYRWPSRSRRRACSRWWCAG
ncbi:hypothetical protein [Streptomyces sp. NPDC001315]|uniref:hypothetical protein n=1 Tax=Streptomyces sp. NPDC001315 TaxID=3364562 RepID=UPI0036AB4428